MSNEGSGSTELDPRIVIAQKVYTKRILSVYDPLVLHVFCGLIWGAAPRHMLRLYDRNVSSRHLELGPGTGYFLRRCRFPVPKPEITLVDLSEECLTSSAERLRQYDPATCKANLLEPLPLPSRHFDSVGLNLVMHTIPGGWAVKGAVFKHAAACMRPGGTLFGSTVLAEGVPMGAFTRRAMAEQYRRGNFQNQGDDPDGLKRELYKHFASVNLVIRGCVALFEAAVGD